MSLAAAYGVLQQLLLLQMLSVAVTGIDLHIGERDTASGTSTNADTDIATQLQQLKFLHTGTARAVANYTRLLQCSGFSECETAWTCGSPRDYLWETGAGATPDTVGKACRHCIITKCSCCENIFTAAQTRAEHVTRYGCRTVTLPTANTNSQNSGKPT